MFDALHRRHKASDAMLYAFDLLEFDGEDLRPLSLAERMAKLARLLARKPLGIVFNEPTHPDHHELVHRFRGSNHRYHHSTSS
jgi:ATP-dependent DNA ligase